MDEVGGGMESGPKENWYFHSSEAILFRTLVVNKG